MDKLAALSLGELETLLGEYPWFTLARREYVRRKRGVPAAAAPAPAPAAAVSAATEAPVPAATATEKPRVVAVGGDYFDKREYVELEEAGLAFDSSSLAFNPVATAVDAINDGEVPQAAQASSEAPAEDPFCTETLAKVYLEQGLSQKAIEVYEKLILVYPQKSAYFAALIDKAKNIKQ